MTGRSLAIFEAAIGTCAVVWSARGVAGVQLPETTELATRAWLLRRFPDAEERDPPPSVQRAIEAIVALLRGEARDLRDLPLDLDGVPEFNRRVYEIARAIPPGKTMTYGEIAKQLGDRLLARAVGQALGHNPVPLIVPCHRVVAASGKSGGFSAGGGGVVTKLRLLTIEGAQPTGPTLFDRLPLEARATRR
jgi:methylated-DNA-[protein]-cysteine S-methyltransferase